MSRKTEVVIPEHNKGEEEEEKKKGQKGAQDIPLEELQVVVNHKVGEK